MKTLYYNSNFFKDTITKPEFFVVCILLLSLFSSLFFLAGFTYPLGLLFGPSLCFYLRPGALKNFFVHCLPFISAHVILILFDGRILTIEFVEWYSWSGMISFFSYGLSGMSIIQRSRKNNIKNKLGSQLSFLFIICSFFIGIFTFSEILNEDVGFEPKYLIFSTIFILGLVSFLHLHKLTRFRRHRLTGDNNVRELNPEKFRPSWEADNIETYLNKLNEDIKKEGIYLNSNLTLEKLSEELEIPKHHLSFCFSSHLDTTFYEFIAQHRISYAIDCIESNNSLKLESLAHDSGFNSKTSFNKHFKKITGLTPSEYRNKCVSNLIEF